MTGKAKSSEEGGPTGQGADPKAGQEPPDSGWCGEVRRDSFIRQTVPNVCRVPGPALVMRDMMGSKYRQILCSYQDCYLEKISAGRPWRMKVSTVVMKTSLSSSPRTKKKEKKTSLKVAQKIKNATYDPAIPLLGLYPKALKSVSGRDLHMPCPL